MTDICLTKILMQFIDILVDNSEIQIHSLMVKFSVQCDAFKWEQFLLRYRLWQL